VNVGDCPVTPVRARELRQAPCPFIDTCDGGAAQRWTVTGSTVQINGKCLDVTGN
jgi:hypothetical protein